MNPINNCLESPLEYSKGEQPLFRSYLFYVLFKNPQMESEYSKQKSKRTLMTTDKEGLGLLAPSLSATLRKHLWRWILSQKSSAVARCSSVKAAICAVCRRYLSAGTGFPSEEKLPAMKRSNVARSSEEFGQSGGFCQTRVLRVAHFVPIQPPLPAASCGGWHAIIVSTDVNTASSDGPLSPEAYGIS